MYSYNADGTGSREQTFEVAVQSDVALRSFSVLSIPFAGASERVVFGYARVRHADGSIVETDLTTVMEQPEQVTREAPLYSDLKQAQLPVKSLRVGDTLEWQVHIDRSKAEAAGQFWGQQSFLQGAIVQAETVELRIPAGKIVTVWTNPRSGVKPESSEQKGNRVFVWKTSAFKPTAGAQAEAEAKARKTKVLTAEEDTDATEGKLPDVAWTTFPSWEAVGAWYRSLEDGRSDPDATITARVKEITANKATDREKAQAVYDYVAKNVRYVGIDLGVGRYQPHQAASVLDNQYGDCKDKHTLLAAMFRVLGLKPDAVLIGASIRFNEAVPSPGAFNHLITRVHIGDEVDWLDSTEEVAPWRMMFAALRDKQALVVPLDSAALIARTPAEPPFLTSEKMTATGALDKEGVSESHFTLTMRGDEELLIRSVLRQITPAQYDQFTQNFVGSLGFGGTVSHSQFQHVQDTTQPLVMEFDYHREHVGDDWGNLRTLPQLMIVLLPTVDEKDPPVQSFRLLGARSVTSTSEMKLPTGWGAEIPEAIHAKSEFGTYDLTFRFEKGALYADRHWTVLKEKVPQAEWKRYKAWMDEVSPGTEPYVQLRRAAGEKVSSAGSAETSAAATSSTEAARLVEQAQAAIQDNRLEDGSKLLDQAKALNPQQWNLWGDYGFLHIRQGNQDEAIRAYSKEVELHPDNAWVYRPLSQYQYMTGDRSGALATMHRLVAQTPEDPQAATALIALLLDMRKPVDAAKEADAALVRIPETGRTKPEFQLAVGRAQIRGLEIDKGTDTLTTLLEASSDPLMMNDAAYELADRSRNLPVAEEKTRQALNKLTDETRTWTLDEAPDTLRAKSALVAAAWDTMGWVLYREGKPKEAEPYIRACWLNRPTVEVGQHLGDVQRTLGRREDALQSYGLALASAPTHDMMGVRSPESPETTDLRRKIATFEGTMGPNERKVSSPTLQGAEHQLQQLRTVQLPGALVHDGTAEYRLLLSAEGVQKVRRVSKELEGGDEFLMKMKLPAGMFPPGSEARLVRSGMLNCHQHKCEWVWLH